MNTRQRWVCAIGVVIVLVNIGQAVRPFDVRTGRFVFQRENCPAPVVRLFKPEYVDNVKGVCWDPSMQRVVGAAVIVGLACVGVLVLARLFRDRPPGREEVPRP